MTAGRMRVLWTVAAVTAGVTIVLNRSFYHDDAYITLRYARNLITGGGAVWNPGEYVQGYTNFLHLVLISILGSLGVDLVLASRLIGFAAFGALIATLILFGRHISTSETKQLSQLPAALVAMSTPLLVWSLGGLESVLFAWLAIMAALLLLIAMEGPGRPRLMVASGICFALAFLTRPDGMIFAAISIAWVGSQVLARRCESHMLIRLLLPIVVITAPYVSWQLWYYGDVVPNTFYVKADVSGVQRIVSGLSYLMSFSLTPPFLPSLAVASASIVVMARRWTPALSYLAIAVTAYLAFVLYVGGDHMPAFRLLLPVIPLLVVMLQLALVSFEGHRAGLGSMVMAAAIGLSCFQVFSSVLNPKEEDRASRSGTIVGKYIEKTWPPGSLVALNTAGSTPYYAPHLRFIDMLGLNDAHIARRKIERIELPWQGVPGHAKGDGAYVLGRSPDYIILGPARGSLSWAPWFLSDLEIVQDPRFVEGWTVHEALLDDDGREVSGDGMSFWFFARTNRR